MTHVTTVNIPRMGEMEVEADLYGARTESGRQIVVPVVSTRKDGKGNPIWEGVLPTCRLNLGGKIAVARQAAGLA